MQRKGPKNTESETKRFSQKLPKISFVFFFCLLFLLFSPFLFSFFPLWLLSKRRSEGETNTRFELIRRARHVPALFSLLFFPFLNHAPNSLNAPFVVPCSRGAVPCATLAWRVPLARASDPSFSFHQHNMSWGEAGKYSDADLERRREAREARRRAFRKHISKNSNNTSPGSSSPGGPAPQISSDFEVLVLPAAATRDAPKNHLLSGRTVTLVASNGVAVQVSEEGAFLSDTIRFMFEASMREQRERRAVLEIVDEESLRRVVEFMEAEIECNFGKSESHRVVFQFGIGVDQLASVLQAAHFLQLRPLMDLSCTMLAHNIEDVADLSELPIELWEMIFPRISVRAMCALDAREDFQTLKLEAQKFHYWASRRDEVKSTRHGATVELALGALMSDASCVSGAAAADEGTSAAMDDLEKMTRPNIKAETVAAVIQQECDAAVQLDVATAAWRTLSELGRHVVTAHTLQIYLARVLPDITVSHYVHELPNVRQLHLINAALTQDELQEFASAVGESCLHLDELSLKSMDLTSEHAALVTAACWNVRVFDFTGNRIASAEPLAETLGPKCEELVLASQSDLVVNWIECLTKPLRKISVSDCGLSPSIDWAKLLSSDTLDVLDLSDTRLGRGLLLWNEKSAGNFCDALAENRTLGELNLAGTLWSDDLISRLVLPKSLHTLNLTGCLIDEEGLMSLARQCVSEGGIRHLSLSDNNVGSTNFTRFVRVIEVPSELPELRLSENNRCSLETLTLRRAHLDDRAIDALIALRGRFPGMTIDVRDNTFSEDSLGLMCSLMQTAPAEVETENTSMEEAGGFLVDAPRDLRSRRTWRLRGRG
jgi:hypothetical protein